MPRGIPPTDLERKQGKPKPVERCPRAWWAEPLTWEQFFEAAAKRKADLASLGVVVYRGHSAKDE